MQNVTCNEKIDIWFTYLLHTSKFNYPITVRYASESQQHIDILHQLHKYGYIICNILRIATCVLKKYMHTYMGI